MPEITEEPMLEEAEAVAFEVADLKPFKQLEAQLSGKVVFESSGTIEGSVRLVFPPTTKMMGIRK